MDWEFAFFRRLNAKLGEQVIMGTVSSNLPSSANPDIPLEECLKEIMEQPTLQH